MDQEEKAVNKMVRKPVWAILATFSLVLGLTLWPLVSSASPARQAGGSASVTVPAGGTATLTVRGFCMDFGKPFPPGNTSPNGLADDKIRAALNYSIQKGYTEGSPDQVELAVWFLRDNRWHNDQHTIAQEIVNNATSAPPSTGTGTSLSDAVSQNKVTVTATFTPQTAGHFYGDSTIQIKNSGNADIQIFLPIGTVFSVPGATGQYQNLAAYALGTQNAQPTAQATSSATAPVAATAPVTTTAVVTTTVVATTTTVVAPTSTTAVSTPTTAPTEALPTTAPTQEPTQTPMPAPTSAILPQTGGGSGGGGTMLPLIALITLASLLVVGGFWLKSRRKVGT